MRELDGARLPALPISGLERIRDLERFDGPLLTHFRHRRRGDNYLYYWCDCDDVTNRWMILRVSETNIIRLANRFVPLDFVVPNACQDDFVYFEDIGRDGRPTSVTLTQLECIPSDYVPVQGAYLDPMTSHDLHSYPVLIERQLSIQTLSDIPRLFSQVYAFVYCFFVLRPQELSGYPWRGGFSTMHFYHWLASRVPGEYSPSVDTLQYASPGFIRFSSLDPKVIIEVGNLITRAVANAPKIIEQYSSLMNYIRANKLNDIQSSDDSRWSNHNDELIIRTRSLLEALHYPDLETVIAAAPRAFEAAKVVTSFTRRLRDLANLGEGGLVRFPPLTDDQPSATGEP